MRTTRIKKEDECQFDWQNIFSGWMVSFLRSFVNSLLDDVEMKIDGIVRSIRKSLVAVMLFFVGMIFAFIGVAIFINELFNLNAGIGYFSVGVFSILVGLLNIKK